MKKRIIIGALLSFMLCFMLSASVNATAGGGGRGGTYQEDNHDTAVADRQYESTTHTGGYGGQVDYSYDMTGQVEYNGRVIDVNITLEEGSKNMNLHDAVAWDPRNDISSIYTYGDMGPNAALWAKLAADTGIGTAADWGNGNIKILGPGLQASINLDIHLTGQATIGDYKISDGVLNLSFPPASSDLQALLSGNALKSLDGTVMLGKSSLAIFAGKQDTVEFKQLLQQLKDLGIPVEDILYPDDPEDPDPDPDPKPDKPEIPKIPETPPHAKLTVTFDPTTCDWTNDPYIVTATVSGLYNRDDPAPVYLVNCAKHCADDGCDARYCGGHNPHTVEDIEDGVKVGEHTEYDYWDDGCCVCGGVNHTSGRGPYTSNHCGGYTSTCYAWAHKCYRSTAKWAWELGVDVLQSHGSCGGSIIGTQGEGTETLTWKIGILGVWNAQAYFKCLPNQTREGKYPSITYQSWPLTGDDLGDSWDATLPNPADINKTSGPYKFDDKMPVLTISTGTYGVGGTYTGNATVDAKSVHGNNPSKYWTNQNINFTVSLSDDHAGPDMGRSYIKINGKKLHSTDNYGACSESRGMGSFTLTQSGEYYIQFHCEDRAYLGCTSAEDGVPNMFDVYYYVYIDKIPPVVRYGFDDEKVLYNDKRDRYETTGEAHGDRTEPYWWVTASDKYSINCSEYAASGLKEAWAYTTQDKSALDRPKEFAMKGHKFATSNMGANEWKYELISDEALKAGYDVYLILYAVDNVGNEAFTTTYLAKKTDYIDGNDPDHLAPKNHQHIDDSRQRRLPTSMLFIDRAKILKENSNERGPLEITRVFDVNWEGTLTWNKPARSNTFAVYRNAINDMIGLGYRVNFRYNLIGFGIDKGDKCTLQFYLYGHKGNGFEKLDIYVQNPDGNTYTKVDASNEYYRRTYENTYDILPATFTVDDENNMMMNEGRYVLGTFGVDSNGNTVHLVDNTNDATLYFNYTIPATAKFKYSSASNPATAKGSDKDWYTGTEILVKVNLWSKKWMDPSGKILYELLKDECIPWGPNGQVKEFYGTSYTVPSLGKGQAFWYDGTTTAITDITGHKSN